MSVAVTVQASMIPIYRAPPIIGVNPSIMARWIAQCAVTGDGSGGTYDMVISLATAVNLFGSRTLWDLKFFNAKYGGALVNPFGQLTISTGEPPGIVNMVYNVTFETTTVLCQNFVSDPCKDMKFGFQYQQGNYPYLRMIMLPNTNAVACGFCAGGFIYDERYL